MNEQKNNGRGVFYGVIGVATLVVAIIGATFAYFTATASNNNVIKGNMATINFGLSVTKVTHVDESKGGMIPMSNVMVEAAVSDSTVTYEDDATGAGTTCVDDNGNAVCQIYKITATNTGTASLFLDGYITLTGGSGVPTDFTSWTDYRELGGATAVTYPTTMRWAQVFCTGSQTDEITGCTTAGVTTTGATKQNTEASNISGIDVPWSVLGTTKATDAGVSSLVGTAQTDAIAYDVSNILTSGITNAGYISGNDYDIINKNFIRVSDHDPNTSYDRVSDVTSALVFNQYLDAAGGDNAAQDIYIVVWLSETGTDQTAGSSTGPGAFANKDGLNFFSGNVTFNSAQGSEVTATFSGYTAVPSDQL